MQDNKRKLFWASWIILISMVAMTVATYAWMSIASSFKLSDLELSIITDNVIEIALDQGGQPGEWTTFLPMDTLSDPEAVLRPVTWSAKSQTFYAPQYGLDGRISFVKPIQIMNFASSTLPPSANEAEEAEGAGYLIVLDLWMRTGTSDVTVYLSAPASVSEEQMGNGTFVVGAPVWDGEEKHLNGGNGAENAIRIGIRSYDEPYEAGKFVIYEPNASEDTTVSIDGTPLEGADRLIRQEASKWVEQFPILRDQVDYEMGQFLTEDLSLFKLQSNTPRRFTVYIWLEGQDAQCDNSISAGQIIANLQFTATAGDDYEDVVRPKED